MTFPQFWATWPRNPRKGSKSLCLRRWEKGYFDTQAETIIKHVEWMKTTTDWLKDNGAFIPAPLVYLNQMRWDGADVPEPAPVRQIDPALAAAYERVAKAVPMPEHLREKYSRKTLM